MPRNCGVCSHPDVEEINKLLIEGRVSYVELEEKYGLTNYSLYRHKRNHLEPVIQELKEHAKETAQKDFIEAKEAANMILKYLPEILADQKPTLKEIIDVLKIVNGTDERGSKSRDIVITWGIGAGDKGKIQLSDMSEHPEGISEKEVEEIESEAERRKTEKRE